jgi:hypothetical protein
MDADTLKATEHANMAVCLMRKGEMACAAQYLLAALRLVHLVDEDGAPILWAVSERITKTLELS